tara:strand:- start:1950 stop:2411 length:462 start_codon:yes stop_codon:yes gene_type:complete
MTDDDLVAKYAAEAKQSLDQEAQKRIEESVDPIYEAKLRARSIFDMIESDDLVPALLARLGSVRAALDGHGGGIEVESHVVLTVQNESTLDFVLDLTGACLSCGAAPGTLDGIKADLEADDEISNIRFSSALLDTFDELGREFILAHGNVEFV